MATILDAVFLNNFSPIFVLLLVFAITYAILKSTKVLGSSNGIAALVSIAVTFIVMVSTDSQNVIKSIVPLFFFLILFIVIILIGLRFLGMSEDVITGGMKKWGPVHTAVLVVVCVIFAIGLSNTFGNKLLPASTNSSNTSGQYEKNVTQAIFNPKVLGTILILLISMFAILLLTAEVQK